MFIQSPLCSWRRPRNTSKEIYFAGLFMKMLLKLYAVFSPLFLFSTPSYTADAPIEYERNFFDNSDDSNEIPNQESRLSRLSKIFDDKFFLNMYVVFSPLFFFAPPSYPSDVNEEEPYVHNVTFENPDEIAPALLDHLTAGLKDVNLEAMLTLGAMGIFIYLNDTCPVQITTGDTVNSLSTVAKLCNACKAFSLYQLVSINNRLTLRRVNNYHGDNFLSCAALPMTQLALASTIPTNNDAMLQMDSASLGIYAGALASYLSGTALAFHGLSKKCRARGEMLLSDSMFDGFLCTILYGCVFVLVALS